MKKPLLELLKDLSALLVGAAALLYIFGYTVQLAYSRVLGVESVGQPLDYVRYAADYGASIISSVPQLLFGARYYVPKLFQRPMIGATVGCIVILALSLLLYLPIKRFKLFLSQPRTKKAIQPWRVFQGLLHLITIGCLVVLLHAEFDIVKVRDVLQTVDSDDIQQMQKQIANAEATQWDNVKLLELRVSYVSKAYDKYILTHRDSPGFHYWNRWFNPKAEWDNGADRSASYLALLLLNIVVLVAVAFQLLSLLRSSKRNDTSVANVKLSKKLGRAWSVLMIVFLIAGIGIQVFLFPFIYATLGRYFVYPVVRLKLASEANKAQPVKKEGEPTVTPADKRVPVPDGFWTHGVYLIGQSDSELVVYDRLNFFQIKHVPRTRILAVSQLFSVSPFESCSKQEDELIPCEILWMPEDTSLSDF
jgi:hypothetical protein